MRLTLRTLLAWMDDTLSPSEVHEIGRQVSESPFAKELTGKIHRVTRQRRLTVPPTTGPDSVDPNVVASYLDNELPPELVGELEKRCLVSDVHLAEVASVHQILSLIGHKAKVPAEARHRMYKLIKGREAVEPAGARGPAPAEPREAVEPANPWDMSPPPARRWLEQIGPPVGVLVLIGILCATAMKTLKGPEAPSQPQQPALVQNTPAPAQGDGGNATPAAPVKGAEKAPPRDETPKAHEAEKEKAGATTTGDEPPATKEEGAPKAKDAAGGKDGVPPGSVGLARKTEGVLLRFNADRREWERLTAATPLKEQDRLLSLAPYRASVEVGTADVDLVGETEVWVRSTPPTHAARLILAQGRVVLHGTRPSLPFDVQFAGKSLKVTPPPGGAVALERVNRRPPGEPKAAPPVLRVYAADGPVRLESGSNEMTLDNAGAVTLETDGSFSGETSKAPPGWVTETEPPPFDQARGEEFAKFLPPDRPVIASLVEASEDDQKDVCRLAVSALRAVGDISYVVPLLNDRGTGTSSVRRKAAANVLRGFLAQGPDSARDLRTQLQRELGEDQAAVTEKLLVGYTAKEADDRTTYEKLVKHLGNTDPSEVGVRTLALDNLMTLTGRDDLDYDPEKPEGKGLKAWKDLLAAKELKRANAAKGEK